MEKISNIFSFVSSFSTKASATSSLTGEEAFETSGPTYLTNVDWDNKSHQRVVASCLVNAAYLDLLDHQPGRSEMVAPPWCQFFGFEIHESLVEKEGLLGKKSYFGVIFRKTEAFSSSSAPDIVIALRGTVTAHDWGVNVDSWLSLIDTRECFKVALQAVEKFANDSKCKGNIWLCGHSLGATIANGIGQAMADKGIFVHTFLFNPPFRLDPTTKNLLVVNLGDIFLKVSGNLLIDGAPRGLVLTRGVVSSSIVVLQHLLGKNITEEQFVNRNAWAPRVYVDPIDDLSMQYIEYFKASRAVKREERKLPERIASAVLVIASNGTGTTTREAHTLTQWWKRDLLVKTTCYSLMGDPKQRDDEPPLLSTPEQPEKSNINCQLCNTQGHSAPECHYLETFSSTRKGCH